MVTEPTLADLDLFKEEEHEPFFWPGSGPAALLVHGFPGTPAEMRPLATTLREQGWTTQGLLLPGFGSEIASLYEHKPSQWVDHTRQAVVGLKADHHPVLLVGYSMGAAVSLQVAATSDAGAIPDGLVLLAPFWRIGTRLQALVWRSVSTIFRTIKPLRSVSFDDPRVREGVGGFLPDLNLDSPAVQQSLRNLKVPTSFINRLLALGRASDEAAAQVSLPTLIIQGIDDQVMRPATTRQLLGHFPGPIRYVELDADHELLTPGQAHWPQLISALQHFTATLDVHHSEG
ncbi:MAG: alpha/beta fold hydrolase [Candidatus Promineifilaceae bacterium]|nr:alpha/beta fold hydrolase [Candidatus Promineifilaceae bacterium]